MLGGVLLLFPRELFFPFHCVFVWLDSELMACL